MSAPAEDMPTRILDATVELVRRHGPAKTTVSDIARALSMSHANVYRHFASKDALFEAAAQRWLVQIMVPLDQMAAKFDQVSGACAPVLDPLALVIAASGEIEPIAQHGQAPELGFCRPQLRQQGCRLQLWSRACFLPERRLARVRSTSRRLPAASWPVPLHRAMRRQGPRWAWRLRLGPGRARRVGLFSET